MAVTTVSQGIYAGAALEFVQNMMGDFVSDLSEEARRLSDTLSADPNLDEVRRFAFATKGQAHNFGLTLLELVAVRLEDYVSACSGLSARGLQDVRTYLDAISDIGEGAISGDSNAAEFVRRLPARPNDDISDDIEIRSVEVMLVMLHGAQTRFVARELQACGYRVSLCTSTIAALEQAVHTKPDMMIVSAMMPGLSGLDLAMALTNMPETRNIPVAVITSMAKGSESLKVLPQHIPLIRKNAQFGDDLAAALAYHFLL